MAPRLRMPEVGGAIAFIATMSFFIANATSTHLRGELMFSGFVAVAVWMALASLQDWWRKRGDLGATTLPGAEKIPLELTHPYLTVRASRVPSGRVAILVEGIAKDVSIQRRDDWREETLEQRTGDAPFDAKFRVKGNSLTCRSLLDAPMREALREAFDAFPGLAVNAGVVSWNGRPADVPGSAARLLELASKLLPPDLIAGLEKSALSDPSPANRQRSLDLLIRRFPDAPETRRIAAAALADTEPAIRLRAAIFLGDEGRTPLATLAASEGIPADVRAEAVRNAGLLAPDVAATIVRDALTDRREIVRHSAIATVRKLKLANCNDRLAVLLRRAEPQHQLAIVEAAAATEHESAELPLLAALEIGSPEAKLAAARLLGPIGTIRAVEPLLALRGSQLLMGALGPAAAESVAAIQARLAGAGAGQLALTDTNGGEMSFPGAEAGALSRPDSEAGDLSLTQEEVEGRPPRRAPTRQTS